MLSAVLISLTGVMMPGPVFAVTVAKSYDDIKAGSFIALGHGVVEFPLMILIYLGFAGFFASGFLRFLVSLIGGVMLIYMAIGMLKVKTSKNFGGGKSIHHNSLVAGILTTAANPYFFLWWATIGFALIVNTTIFGLIGFVTFMFAHWLCDFSWYTSLSIGIFKSRKILGEKTRKWLFNICALILMFFGLWFILSALYP